MNIEVVVQGDRFRVFGMIVPGLRLATVRVETEVHEERVIDPALVPGADEFGRFWTAGLTHRTLELDFNEDAAPAAGWMTPDGSTFTFSSVELGCGFRGAAKATHLTKLESDWRPRRVHAIVSKLEAV